LFNKKKTTITLETLSDLCTGDENILPVHKIKEIIVPSNMSQNTVNLNIDLSELDFGPKKIQVVEEPIIKNIQIKKEEIRKFKWL
jgi:hypothetical protein